jgi:hypothetical protein
MKKLKKFLDTLISDSNRVSSKRVIGLLTLIMFMAYGIKGLIQPFNLQFWIFYVSLCAVTMWIAFRFMSAEKALKYNILGQLAKFNMKDAVQQVIGTEAEVDDAIQPDKKSNDGIVPDGTTSNNDSGDLPLNS